MAAEIAENRALQPLRTLRDLLERQKPQLLQALPSHLKADRFIRVVLTAVQRSPALLKCTPLSVVGAVMEAAQLGLEPDGVLGHAYLVPYGTQCQLIIGYKGLVQLARNSGEVAHISAHVVYANDVFEFEYGSNEHLTHKPALHDRGDPVAAYAMAFLTDKSAPPFEVMSVEDINRVRANVPGSNRADSPWTTDWSEMARKTPLRRLAKFLPLAVEAQRTIAQDELNERGIVVEAVTKATQDYFPVEAEPRKQLEANAEETLDGANGDTRPLEETRAKCKDCGAAHQLPHRKGCPSFVAGTAEPKQSVRVERTPGSDDR